MRSFDKVLELCHNKIKDASTKELTKMYFDVPEYVIGLPMYNLSNCIEHIVRCLKQNGFHVIYYFPKYKTFPTIESTLALVWCFC